MRVEFEFKEFEKDNLLRVQLPRIIKFEGTISELKELLKYQFVFPNGGAFEQ